MQMRKGLLLIIMAVGCQAREVDRGAVSSQLGLGADRGYRYNHGTGVCANAMGEHGRSPLYFGVCGDLRNVRLTTYDLPGAVMMGVDVSQDQYDLFDWVTFRAADLRGMIANNTAWASVDFIEANLERAQFNGATLTGNRRVTNRPKFVGARLRNAQFRRAQIYYADFTRADLRGADFRGAVIGDRMLSEVVFTGARYDQYTKLPFSRAVADSMGMVFVGSAEPFSAPDKFEPDFPIDEPFRFLGPCEGEAACDDLYGEAAVKEVLIATDFAKWVLLRVTSEAHTTWRDDYWGGYWVDTPSSVQKTQAEAARYCRGLPALDGRRFELPQRGRLHEAIDLGLLDVLPDMRAEDDAFWTADMRNSEYYYYLLSGSGLTNFWAYVGDPLRVVCVSP